MQPIVYVTRRIPKEGLDLLAQSCRVLVNSHDRALKRDELLDAAREAQGMIGLLTDRIDAEFMDAAPALRGYANYAVGFDNIDVAEATRRGLPVSNTPDVLTNATAELAWALLLAAARRLVEAVDVMRSGQWPGWGPMQFRGFDIVGRTLGICGAGRIGTRTALMARGFDMDLVYFSRRPNPTLDAAGARQVDFDELLAVSDYISIHTPLTPETRHLFDAEAFAKMKNTAVLVNTARGPVINEAHLAAALRHGEIGAAGLDVYEFEPRAVEGLLALKNLVPAPHIGSATFSARRDMALLAARNLLAMLRGEKPETCLNPEIFQD